ncbi:hypothetical protein ACIGBL_33425 [Streptomyces sp. NPDC085614]|uniref:hypothetical protein n=1 Tax=Streptomyces sp. NPDC085614 TaxID=3365733 RepID=UPI0037D89E26
MQFRTEAGDDLETDIVAGRLYLTTYSGTALTVCLSPTEARQLAGELNRFADDED